MELIEKAIGAMLSVALPASLSAFQRSEFVIKILKSLDFEPDHPPRNFSGVYVYALVEYGVGKEKALWELFKSEEIRKAFRESLDKGDLSLLYEEIDRFIDWNILGDQIKDEEIDIRQEVKLFAEKFSSVVDRSRMPVEVRSEQKIDKILQNQEKFESMLASKVFQVDPGMEEPSEVVEKSFKDELDTIKDLIDTNKFISARERLKKLEVQIKESAKVEKETIFLIYAYLAQTYLNSAQDQEKAIPYLVKAAEKSPDEERKYRNIAVAHLLKGEIEDGLNAINNALELKPDKIQSVNIKVNLLISGEKYDQARGFLTEESIKDDAQLCTLRAKLELLSNDSESAIGFARRAIELDDQFIDSYLIKCEAIRMQVKERIEKLGVLDIAHKEKLEEAIGDLTTVIELLDETENDKYALALAQRGVIHNLMHDPSKGRKDLEKAKALLPGNESILVNLGLSCWAMDDYDSALENIEASGSDDFIIHLIIIRVTADNGKIADAIGMAEEFLEKQPDNDNELRMHRLYIELLDRNFQTTNAEEKLKEYETKYSGRPEITLAKAEHFMRLGDYDGVISLLEPCYEENSGILKTRMMRILADAHFKKNGKSDYRRAAELYEIIADTGTLDGALMALAASLYNSGQLAKCLAICVKAKETHGFVDYLAQLEVYIYLSTENFQYASLVLIVLMHKHPDNIRYILEYGNCMHRLGERQKAIDVLKQAERKVGDDANGIALISTAYAAAGKFEDALRLALQARQIEPNTPSYHTNFFFIFLRAQNFIEKMDDKYIAAFREIADTFNEEFPGEPGIEKKEMPRDPEELRKVMVELLEPFAHRGRELEKIYREKHLPISFMAEALGRNIVSTWSAISINPMLRIWCSSGDANELSQEKASAEATKSIIIDPISLLTLESLGLFSKLTDLYKEVYICQSTIDTFRQLIDVEQITAKDEFRIFLSEDGELVRVPIPPDISRHNIELCNGIIEEIAGSDKVHVIGKTIRRLHEEGSDVDNNIALNFGEETSETILEAHAGSLTMFAEDWLIRRFVEQNYGIRAFGTRAFLNVLLENGMIGEGRFHELLIELIQLNYHFVLIYPETLYHSAMSEGFSLSSRSMLPFEALRHLDYVQPTVVNLAVGFLQKIWLGDVGRWHQINWTNYILNVITCNRSKRAIIEQIRIRKGEILTGLMPPGILNEFDGTINDWIAAQKII